MKERPILFSGPMVRAILEGRKGQTRRALKPQPESRENESVPGHYGTFFHGWNLDHPAVTDFDLSSLCPYGRPGDRLWVRETWSMAGMFNKTKPSDLDHEWSSHQVNEGLLWYRADGEQEPGATVGDKMSGRGRWRPSIHMPRWASRILLEITDVRVERLQDISDHDALSEGIEVSDWEHGCCPYRNYRKGEPGQMNRHCSTPGLSFLTLWESINGAGSWAENPYVWRVEFKQLTQA
jgi:hypothetical protein